MRKFEFLLVCSGMVAMGLSGGALGAQTESRLIEAKRLIGEGVDQWNERTMLEALMLFEECLAGGGDMGWLAHYYIGYADFRLSTYHRVQGNRESQLKYLQDGVDHLRAARDSNYDFAEAHALLALLAGQMGRMNPSQMASLGMEAQGEISEARRLGGENPRVAMLSGVLYFFTPAQFGGSKIKAVEEIKRSVSLYESERPQDERLPDWGHGDALAWLARLYMETGELELAKRSLERAFEVDPQNILARRVRSQFRERMKSPR